METRRASLGKTTRPSLSGIQPRERLFALLDQARERSIGWLSGPPGCGKTTAVASYLDHAGIRCLWYQMDERDAEVATFFYYLGQAAAELSGARAPRLPLLAPEYQAGLAAFSRRYFELLYARLKPPFAVVFDGYHEVAQFSPLHGLMRDALAALPRGGCAFVLSRGDPPAELARLRASSAVALLGWEELRLTRAETDAIALRRRPDLARAALDQLYARTQGWAAGLVLMLEQARMSGAMAEPPDFAAGQVVFDYLAGEIFQKSDASTQDFLLRTAHLPQMTAAMASTLSGQAGADRILADLHRNSFFVALRQGQPEPVYQLHPMFREFLLARGLELHAKDQRRQLQRVAAAAMEAAAQFEEAVALYRDSHDWDEMARLIHAQAPALLAQGRGETLTRWAEDLPPEAGERHPWTMYWAAASQAQLAPREGRVLFEKAFALFRARSPADLAGMALAAAGAMDAILYELDDFSLLDRWIAVLDEAERDGVRYPSAEAEARVACSMVFSLTLRQPQRRDIERWMERALAKAREAQDPNLRMFVALLCALTLMWTGLYGKALALIETMRRGVSAPGVTPFSLLTLKNVEAMYYMLTAQRAPCLEAARAGLEIARSTGVHTWTLQLLVYAYGGALAEGDLESAAGFARDIEPHLAGAGRFNLCLYHHFQAWEAALRQDLMRALHQERTALRMAVEVGCPYFEVLCRLALAEVLAECGDERKCIAQLQQLRPLARAIDNRHLEYTCLVGFGRLALDHGRQRPGLNALRRGFALGREYDYSHMLWWRPAPMARACGQALAAGVEAEYAKSLIRRRNLSPEALPASLRDWPWLFRVHTLGEFRLLKNDAPLAAGSKAQRKPLDMLKVLIAYGGENVSEGRVIEALWPRIDGDSAHRSFTSTLHRLRKHLGEDRAVLLRDGKLSLDRRFFWVDTWAFEALMGEIDAALKKARQETGALDALAERLLQLYRGPFLGIDGEEAWQQERRERMRARLSRAVGSIGRHWLGSGRSEHSRELTEKAFEIDPLAKPGKI
jgi:LuxR family maltose regulon positive regulatory protein